MTMFYKSMAILLSLSAGLQAMEIEAEKVRVESEHKQMTQKYKKSDLTPYEKECAHKMLLIKHGTAENNIPWLLKDIQNIIGWVFCELYLYELYVKSVMYEEYLCETRTPRYIDDYYSSYGYYRYGPPTAFDRLDNRIEKFHSIIKCKFTKLKKRTMSQGIIAWR